MVDSWRAARLTVAHLSISCARVGMPCNHDFFMWGCNRVEDPEGGGVGGSYGAATELGWGAKGGHGGAT